MTEHAHPARVYSQAVLLPDHEVPVPARIDLDGRVIAAVVPQDRATFEASPEASDTLDLGRHLLTPAFVNAHTHLSMVAFRSLGSTDTLRGNVVEDLWFRIEGALTPEDVRAFARIGALECVLSGQGSVYDHYYHAASVALAMADVGLEGVVAEALQDLGGPFADRWSEGLEATEALCEDTRLAEAGIAVAAGPHATDTVSDLLWARIVELARRHALPIHLHVAQSAEEVERARQRGFASPVERLLARGRLDGVERVWLAHGLYVRTQDRTALSPDRDVLVHCPLSQAQFAFPANIQAWRDAGLRIALGTDAGACNDGMDVQREVGLLAHGPAWATGYDDRLQRALDVDVDDGTARLDAARIAALDASGDAARPRAALRAVWDDAGVLHPAHRAGRIAPGHRASLCAWDLDHPALWPAARVPEHALRGLAFGAPSAALHTLLVGGHVIGEVGDPRALLRQARVRDWLDEAHARRDALLGSSRA